MVMSYTLATAHLHSQTTYRMTSLVSRLPSCFKKAGDEATIGPVVMAFQHFNGCCIFSYSVYVRFVYMHVFSLCDYRRVRTISP